MCNIWEKMPLPSVTLRLIQISGQYNSLSPSWCQQSLVSILHLAAFFSVLQDLLKCVYVNSHFLIRVYLLQGWMEVGCCFVVSLSLFMKPLNCSAIYISFCSLFSKPTETLDFIFFSPPPPPQTTTTNFIFSLPPPPLPLPPQKHTTHPS